MEDKQHNSQSLRKAIVPYFISVVVSAVVLIGFTFFYRVNVFVQPASITNGQAGRADTVIVEKYTNTIAGGPVKQESLTDISPATEDSDFLSVDKRIENAITRTKIYLSNGEYDNSTYLSLFYELKSLYAIRGLSDKQNNDLRSMIRALEVHKEVFKPARPRSSNATNAAETRSEVAQEFHVVRKGETIYSLARKYKIEIHKLAALNNIPIAQIDSLAVGFNLRIKE